MSKERDIAYGRHSRIPECCISFYVDMWKNEMYKRTEYYQSVHYSTWSYVPCPKCFCVGNKVKIVNCVVDCGRECWKDFK